MPRPSASLTSERIFPPNNWLVSTRAPSSTRAPLQKFTNGIFTRADSCAPRPKEALVPPMSTSEACFCAMSCCSRGTITSADGCSKPGSSASSTLSAAPSRAASAATSLPSNTAWTWPSLRRGDLAADPQHFERDVGHRALEVLHQNENCRHSCFV